VWLLVELLVDEFEDHVDDLAILCGSALQVKCHFHGVLQSPGR
jgi:hypothetical protein